MTTITKTTVNKAREFRFSATQAQNFILKKNNDGSHRRPSYRYREPWRGSRPEDQGPSEPLFHYPHSKQYYMQRLRQAQENDEFGQHSPSSSMEYRSHHSSRMDLDRPSRSPSPHPLDQTKTEYYGTTKLEQ
ncbi:hypothetical protein DERF_005023 [Dermatophagoides farinae]|nr:hypothetical protein DERF_005023 [Dermatophagoides farinae]